MKGINDNDNHSTMIALAPQERDRDYFNWNKTKNVCLR